MRAWSVLRQLLAVTLCASLAAPAYSLEKTSAAIEAHDQANGGVYPKTRVWGSDAKILHSFSATAPLRIELRWGYEKSSRKTVFGSGVTYDYDAFGSLIHSSFTGIPPGGTTASPTPNEFLFASEQFDPDLNLYYNRARYLNVSTGRFWSMDDFEGDSDLPLSLHKYLYAGSNPVNFVDPSGRDFDLTSLSVNIGISSNIDAITGFKANGIKGAAEGALKGALIGAAFFSFGAVINSGAKLLTFARAASTAGAVALDTNVLIAALEGGELEAVDAALAGRVPVISITAAKEFLLKGDVEVLRQFLIERGGRIGTAALATEIAELQTQATLLGRVLAAADASVVGNAIKEGIPLLTRDIRLINFLTEVGQAVETF